MHLQDAFKQENLTNCQKKAIESINTFLLSDSGIFILKGYAGTGKTFLIKGIASYLNHANKQFRLMAPTGRAAKVIHQKTGHKAQTIHRTIYGDQKISEKKRQGIDFFEFHFRLKDNEDNPECIYIIDESSMISHINADDKELKFGTGVLLEDLFNYVFNIFGPKRKVIFAGDTAQLPPVNTDLSPALDLKYIKSKINLVCWETEMTEVIRQSKTSGILVNATKLRTHLKNEDYSEPAYEQNHPDFIKIEKNQIINKYLELDGHKNLENAIMITHTNKAVNFFNTAIRKRLYPNSDNIQPGDRVLIIKNNYNYNIDLMNGDFGIVKQVSEETEEKVIPIRTHKGIINTQLIFKDCIIFFKDDYNAPQEIECKILISLLKSSNRALSAEEFRALMVDFKNRHADLRPGSEEFAEALKHDPYYNALWLKYGYAVTCHKSQGGEWIYAIVDFDARIESCSKEYFRWAYTAMTRASKTLYYFGLPCKQALPH